MLQQLLTMQSDIPWGSLWIDADTVLSGPCVARVPDFVVKQHGKPTSLITNNGRESAGLALERWACEHAVHYRFITSGPSPERLHQKLQRKAPRLT